MNKNSLYKLLILNILTISCNKLELIDPVGFETIIYSDSIVFAQIGDFGDAGDPEYKVSELVKSWNPDFIISAGDNNYSEGEFKTIKKNLTAYYSDYIFNFDAPEEYKCFGRAFEDSINRFFPTPGNHDANNKNGLIPYYNYFTLPGNESFYKFIWGPVTVFSINSVDENLDKQKEWLIEQMNFVYTPFKIVVFHYPPYSEGDHGNDPSMQWDFYNLGVDVIFSGHEHIYNKIVKKGEEGMYYIVNGLGGRATAPCGKNKLPEEGFTTFCFGGDYGAIKGIATRNRLDLFFYTIENPKAPVDSIVIFKQ